MSKMRKLIGFVTALASIAGATFAPIFSAYGSDLAPREAIYTWLELQQSEVDLAADEAAHPNNQSARSHTRARLRLVVDRDREQNGAPEA
jgi:predicted cation transporter